MLCVDHDAVKPDLLVLGKALSGGVLPVSAVLSSDDCLNVVLAAQEHIGRNPLACRVAMAALTVLRTRTSEPRRWGRGCARDSRT